MADENLAVPENDPISIEADTNAAAGGASVRAFGASRGPGLNLNKSAFKRALNVTGQGATRCRMFHARMAAAALEHMESQINQWLDSENIEIKHVGQVIGVLEGKSPEPNFFVMVWY